MSWSAGPCLDPSRRRAPSGRDHRSPVRGSGVCSALVSLSTGQGGPGRQRGWRLRPRSTPSRTSASSSSSTSMPSAQIWVPVRWAKVANDSSSASLPGVLVQPLDQRAVELDHVGAHQRYVPRPGIAGAGVVQLRSAPLFRAGSEQLRRQPGMVGDQLLLGDLDHDAGACPPAARASSCAQTEGRGIEVQRQIGAGRADRAPQVPATLPAPAARSRARTAGPR